MDATLDLLMTLTTVFAVVGLSSVGVLVLPWSDQEVADSGLAFGSIHIALLHGAASLLGRGEAPTRRAVAVS